MYCIKETDTKTLQRAFYTTAFVSQRSAGAALGWLNSVSLSPCIIPPDMNHQCDESQVQSLNCWFGAAPKYCEIKKKKSKYFAITIS